MNNKPGMASHYRYGNCLNDKCKLGGPGRQVQRLSAHQDFVCQECGKPLHECPPPSTGPDKKILIAAIAGAAVVLGGLGFGAYKFFGSDKTDKPDGDLPVAVTPAVTPTVIVAPAETTDTVGKTLKLIAQTTPADASVVWVSSDDKTASVKPDGEVALLKVGDVNIVCQLNDTVKAVAHIKIVDKKQPKTGGDPGGYTENYALTCGHYSGPMSGGKPNGVGGTIIATRHYSIDLKDGSGNSVSIAPGDKIVDTKFKNGVLQQGQIIFRDGTRKYISGLAERL